MGEMAVSGWRDGPPWWQQVELAPRAPAETVSDPGSWRRASGGLQALDTAVLVGLRDRLDEWEGAGRGDPLAAHRDGRLPRYLAELRGLVEGEPDRTLAGMLA